MSKPETTPATTAPTPRKRRNALELFADQKRDAAAKIAGIKAKIAELGVALEVAEAAEADFIASAKTALGL